MLPVLGQKALASWGTKWIRNSSKVTHLGSCLKSWLTSWSSLYCHCSPSLPQEQSVRRRSLDSDSRSLVDLLSVLNFTMQVGFPWNNLCQTHCWFTLYVGFCLDQPLHHCHSCQSLLPMWTTQYYYSPDFPLITECRVSTTASLEDPTQILPPPPTSCLQTYHDTSAVCAKCHSLCDPGDLHSPLSSGMYSLISQAKWRNCQ